MEGIINNQKNPDYGQLKEYWGVARIYDGHEYTTPKFMALMPDKFFWKLMEDGYYDIPKEKLNQVIKKFKQQEKKEQILNETCELNNQGIAYEKEGKIEEAIRCYEQNVRLGYPATHSYERLCILYRKIGNNKNEMRILEKAIKKFSKNHDSASWFYDRQYRLLQNKNKEEKK